MPKNSRLNSLEKYNSVQKIARAYSLKEKLINMDQENLSNYSENILKKINKVDKVFSILAEPYKTIIKNTFFEKKELYWWDDCYSKTTFYRLRTKAINSFLLAFNYE